MRPSGRAGDRSGRAADDIPGGAGPRFQGVDLARGLALLGMLAVHAYYDPAAPSPADVIAGGRAATTFAVVAGVSLTFLSGGRNVAVGRRLLGSAAGIAVRGVLIATIGLLLAYLRAADVILGFYGVMFLLAIPLLRLPARVLAGVAAGFAVIGPVVLVATAPYELPHAGEDFSPDLGMLFTAPGAALAVLFVSGVYPVVVYLSYVCTGIAVGRQDLSSRRVAVRLLVWGTVMAVLAMSASKFLLGPLGGMRALIAANGDAIPDEGLSPEAWVLWNHLNMTSWWNLALASPHSNMPLDVAHTTGVALAVLGASLLLMRVPVVRRVLRPLADAGTMTLTIYSAHLFLLASGLLQDSPAALLAVMTLTFVVFATWWRRRFGQGPMERVVSAGASRARRAVAGRNTSAPGSGLPGSGS